MAPFSSLPLVVLREIRNQVRYRHIHTHVAFQATCKKVRSVYLADEAFWQLVCRASGIGRPFPCYEFPFVLATWRELAIICVNHEHQCELEMCEKYQHYSESETYHNGTA